MTCPYCYQPNCACLHEVPHYEETTQRMHYKYRCDSCNHTWEDYAPLQEEEPDNND